MWFSQSVIHDIHTKSIARQLETKRTVLLAGLPAQFTSMLTNEGAPGNRLLTDLHTLNTTEKIVGDIIPFEVWLQNAAYQVAVFPDLQKYFQEKAKQIADKGLAKFPPAKDPVKAADAELDTVEEREIFTNDLLPIGFLAGAALAEKSVARLFVRRFDDGIETTNAYWGTGWLIGKSHIITNYHVIDARNNGEADASEDDFKKQAAATKVQFDYNANGSVFDEREVEKLAARSKQLDYAILRLKKDSGREPLTLWGNEVTLPTNETIALNIIQHPGGAPKQIGLRNNLAAKITTNNLAYFTDTKGGSSGSPVTNDQWQVVALHKAATRTYGKFKFQGKDTEWVNIGTRIDRIIADLESNYAALWTAIEG